MMSATYFKWFNKNKNMYTNTHREMKQTWQMLIHVEKMKDIESFIVLSTFMTFLHFPPTFNNNNNSYYYYCGKKR